MTEASRTPQVLSASPIMLVLAGLLSGAITWKFVEEYYMYRHAPRNVVEDYANNRNAETKLRLDRELYWSGVRNAGLTVGGFGMLLAASFVLSEGIGRQAWGRLAPALVLGGALGLLLGFAGGAAAEVLYRAMKNRHNDPMYKTVLVHITAWVPVALASGLATGIPSRSWAVALRTTAGAMGGGLLAAVAYSPISGLVYPALCSELLVPFGAGNRLMWILLTGSMIGLCGGLAGRHAGPRSDVP